MAAVGILKLCVDMQPVQQHKNQKLASLVDLYQPQFVHNLVAVHHFENFLNLLDQNASH